MPACAPVRVADAATLLGLAPAELDALTSLVRSCGSVLVADVTAEPVAAPAPVRAAAPAWDAPAPAVRTAKCACCGMRRDLVAFTGMAASRPDLCRACGHDRACGRECTSKSRTSAGTFNPADWEV